MPSATSASKKSRAPRSSMPTRFPSVSRSSGLSASAVNTPSSTALSSALAARNARPSFTIRSGVMTRFSMALSHSPNEGRLLRRFHAFGDRSNLGALLLDHGRELCRGADAESRSHVRDARRGGRVSGHGANIGGNSFFETSRHIPPTIKANRALEREFGIPRLRGGRNFRCLGRALAIVHHQQLHLACLHLWHQESDACGHGLNPPLAEILESRAEVAI